MSVALIHCGIAKPTFLSGCEIVRDGNFQFSKQNDGILEWSKKIVNFQQNIDACLITSGRSVEQISIQFIDLNNGGIITEKQFNNQQADEICMQFMASSNHKELMIKISITGKVNKLDDMKLCLTYVQLTKAVNPLDTWTPPDNPPINTSTASPPTVSTTAEPSWPPPSTFPKQL